MKKSGNTILITGGGTGIGLGLAEKFLSNGNKVIICGRRENVLKHATEKYPGLISKTCDISILSERIELFEWISGTYPKLNVLVNNAGIQNWTHLEDEDFFEKSKKEISINIEAPVHLSSLFLRLTSPEVVINVTSGLAFTPLTRVPVYSATKAFFHSFTLSQRHLLKKRGIEVIEIIPPAINTDLGGKGLHDFAPPVADFIASIFKQLEEGGQELTFGYSENMASIGADELKQAFNRMNNQG